jgi:hypothetical protein
MGHLVWLADHSIHAGGQITNPARENRFIVNVALDPGHQVFDICWCWHFRGTLVVLGILPEVLEPKYVSCGRLLIDNGLRRTHRSPSSLGMIGGNRTQ